MDKKLIALLKSANVTHEELNSQNVTIRDNARRKLALAYPSAYVVLEDNRANSLTHAPTIDGIITTKPTNRNLVMLAFAHSAYALQNFRFVSFDNLANVIPIEAAKVSATSGLIGSVTAKTVKGKPFVNNSIVAQIEEPTGLRSLADILESAQKVAEHVVEIAIETVGELAVDYIEEKTGVHLQKKKSV